MFDKTFKLRPLKANYFYGVRFRKYFIPIVIIAVWLCV